MARTEPRHTVPSRAKGRKVPERPSGCMSLVLSPEPSPPGCAQPARAPAFRSNRLLSNRSDFSRKHTHLPAARILSEPVNLCCFQRKGPSADRHCARQQARGQPGRLLATRPAWCVAGSWFSIQTPAWKVPEPKIVTVGKQVTWKPFLSSQPQRL